MIQRALVLCDDFRIQAGSTHGQWVARVARGAGYQGDLIAVHCESDNQAEVDECVQQWGQAQEPELIRQGLYQTVLKTRLGAVRAATESLKSLGPAQQVVVNFSLGSSPAMAVAALLAMGPEAHAQFARAFGSEFAAGLVELANSTSLDPALLQSRQQFATEVSRFESAHNSVVIAAGNDGELAQKLHGRLPAGWDRSDLVTPETTVVGAQGSGYTSCPESVTHWAPGKIRMGQELLVGTSFAAPQIAAALAQLHQQHENASSRELEELLKRRK